MIPNVINIPLKNGMVAIIDSEDEELICQHSWYAISSKGAFYAKTGKNTRMHRLILNVTDSKLIVDHINGNGLDNRKSNLRIVDAKTNVQNRQRSRAGNRCPGVYKGYKKWIAQVTVNYEKHNLGKFDSEDDAIFAVNEFRLKIGRPKVSL